MDQHLLNLLIQELQICKNEIVGKLEELRLGIYETNGYLSIKTENEPTASADGKPEAVLEGVPYDLEYITGSTVTLNRRC